MSGAPGSETESQPASASSTPSAEEPSSSSGETDSSGGETENGSASSSGGEAECGNGIVEVGEDCDDSSEQCRTDCFFACSFARKSEMAGPRPTELTDVAIGPDGEAVAVGRIAGAEEMTQDVLVVRVDTNGDIIEQEAYDLDGGNGEASAVAVDPDGRAYVLVNDGFGDPRVMMFDPDGVLQWIEAPVVQSLRPGSQGLGLALHPDGGSIASGTSAIGSGDSDLFVARYGADGHSWTAGYSSVPLELASNDRGGPVAIGPAGEIYVAGQRPSDLGGIEVKDPLVVGFGPGGEAQWSWSAYLDSTNLQLEPIEVVVDAAGRPHALFMMHHSSSNSRHFALWSFETDGQLRGSFDSDALDYLGGQHPVALVADDAGRVIVVATRIGSEAEDHEGDTVVLGFDEAGEIVCEQRFAETLGGITGAAVTPDGEILVVGNLWEGWDTVSSLVGTLRGF